MERERKGKERKECRKGRERRRRGRGRGRERKDRECREGGEERRGGLEKVKDRGVGREGKAEKGEEYQCQKECWRKVIAQGFKTEGHWPPSLPTSWSLN